MYITQWNANKREVLTHIAQESPNNSDDNFRKRNSLAEQIINTYDQVNAIWVSNPRWFFTNLPVTLEFINIFHTMETNILANWGYSLDDDYPNDRMIFNYTTKKTLYK